MEETKHRSGKLFVSYLVLIIAVLVWVGAWSFPIVAAEWTDLANCSGGLCGTVTYVYSSVVFKALVIGVLALLLAKEFFVNKPSAKLKLNLGFLLIGLLVTAVFMVGLSSPLLSAEPV